MQTFSEKIERWSQRLAPAVVTTFLVLFAAAPLHLPGEHDVMPALALIGIYYWGMHVPGAMPYWFLFALGLIEDTLAGTPLGVSSFINMAFSFLLMRERDNLGSLRFNSVWLGFAALSVAAFTLQWLMLSLYFGRLLPPGPYLLQWCSTLFAYPLMHLLLARAMRLMRP